MDPMGTDPVGMCPIGTDPIGMHPRETDSIGRGALGVGTERYRISSNGS